MENEAALLCVTFRERARVSTCKCNLGYNFLIYLLLLKSSVFVVHFSNAFWHGNEAFLKGSSQNEIAPLLVIFHLPYSKCRGVKICFFTCAVIKIKIFHPCRTHVVRVALVLHHCHIHVARVACVSLVSGARVVDQTRSANSVFISIIQLIVDLFPFNKFCLYIHYSSNYIFPTIQINAHLFSLFH